MTYQLKNKSLKEILIGATMYPESYKIGQVVNNQFKNTAIDFLGLQNPLTTTTILTDTKSNQLWCMYIVPKYRELTIGQIIVGHYSLTEQQQIASIKETWMQNYMSILNRTFNTYSILITTLEAEKTKLMDGVSATRVCRFNDTPQDGGDFSDDTHTTNITQETSSNDLVTKMGRINEIEQKLNDYYSLWANEFGGIFIYD